MNLNQLLKKVLEKKEDNPNRNINLEIIQMYMLLGTRIILIYTFFIFFVGKYLAKILGYDNLYFLSILLATFANICIIFEVIKKSKSK